MNSVESPYPTPYESQPSPSPTFHPGKDLLRRMILGNVFYVFSAFLMMLGSFLLMPTSSIEEAEQFSRRLRSLLILEGYQFLVIATAVLIVRRLKILSDAATLLLIAATLLLDPTFFSNAFLTLRTPESLLVNVSCLLLVPVKLGILQWGLRITFTRRASLAMIFAGVLVYFGPSVFNLSPLPAQESVLYYLLGWMTFGLMLLLPWYGRLFTQETYVSHHLSREQKHWLPRLLVAIPMIVTTIHYLESASVYEIDFYPVYLTPLFFVLAIATLRFARATSDARLRCYIVDALGFLALFFSLPSVTVSSVGIPEDRNLIAEWLRTTLPLAITGMALVATYSFCFRKFTYRPALYRIGLLAVGGFIYLAIQSGWAYTTGRWTFIHVMEYPRLILFLCSPALIALARRYPNFWLWLVECIVGIMLFMSFLPGNLASWFVEIFELSFLAAMILYHRFPDPRNEKLVFAILMAAFGFGRLAMDPSLMALGIVLVEAVGLMVAGYRLSIRGYIWTGCLQAMALFSYGVYRAQEVFSPGYLVLIIGLTLFFIGTGVTFNKKHILKWFD